MNNNHSRRAGARESGLVQRVRNSLRELPIKHPHVLLACSGGKDSVALARILADLCVLNLLDLTIGHIHHGQHHLADSAVDAVKQIGTALDVPVLVKKLKARDIASHTGVGREEALRRERYLALAEMAANTGANIIAVAHHQADQAETVLLHLLRGSGIDGLAGMAAWQVLTIPWWIESQSRKEIGIWRPLLREAESDVATAARHSGLPIVDDPTNIDTSFRRNAIRHNVIPVLEHLSPGATGALSRAAELLSADAEILDELTITHLRTCLTQSGGLIRQRMTELSLAMQRRVVRLWLENNSSGLVITFERVSSVVKMAEKNRGGAQVEIGGGATISLHKGVLTFNPWQNDEGDDTARGEDSCADSE